jgi:hypothetical protein
VRYGPTLYAVLDTRLSGRGTHSFLGRQIRACSGSGARLGRAVCWLLSAVALRRVGTATATASRGSTLLKQSAAVAVRLTLTRDSRERCWRCQSRSSLDTLLGIRAVLSHADRKSRPLGKAGVPALLVAVLVATHQQRRCRTVDSHSGFEPAETGLLSLLTPSKSAAVVTARHSAWDSSLLFAVLPAAAVRCCAVLAVRGAVAVLCGDALSADLARLTPKTASAGLTPKLSPSGLPPCCAVYSSPDPHCVVITAFLCGVTAGLTPSLSPSGLRPRGAAHRLLDPQPVFALSDPCLLSLLTRPRTAVSLTPESRPRRADLNPRCRYTQLNPPPLSLG